MLVNARRVDFRRKWWKSSGTYITGFRLEQSAIYEGGTWFSSCYLGILEMESFFTRVERYFPLQVIAVSKFLDLDIA